MSSKISWNFLPSNFLNDQVYNMGVFRHYGVRLRAPLKLLGHLGIMAPMGWRKVCNWDPIMVKKKKDYAKIFHRVYVPNLCSIIEKVWGRSSNFWMIINEGFIFALFILFLSLTSKTSETNSWKLEDKLQTLLNDGEWNLKTSWQKDKD